MRGLSHNFQVVAAFRTGVPQKPSYLFSGLVLGSAQGLAYTWKIELEEGSVWYVFLLDWCFGWNSKYLVTVGMQIDLFGKRMSLDLYEAGKCIV